jgi:glyoxylase-like metal-dependent hydrolase (beta-lactamase superfamily II)
MNELELRLLYAETHIHADHVTGAWILKRRFGSRIALSSSSAEGADCYLEHGDEIEFGGRHLRSAPRRVTPTGV